MRQAITVATVLASLVAAAPAAAQLGQLQKRLDQAQKIADLKISDKDERAIGEQVSAQLIDRFGVYQDPAVAKYVSLVGTVLAQASSRPSLNWQFIVLDTDGVNAYAAPGGIIHITRGALGLIKSEAELAGVLAHEIRHVTGKHTVHAIEKGKAIQAGTAEMSGGSLTGEALRQLSNVGYSIVFENKFDRNDELDSDEEGALLANKVGYSPAGMSAFLGRIAERNKGMKEPNGLFASHPRLKERQDKLAKLIKDGKLTAIAMGEPRYAAAIKFDAKPAAEIAVLDVEGAKGAVGGAPSGGDSAKKETAKPEEPKKRGFGLGSLSSSLTKGKQAESTQASASAGGRMGVPDRDARGGSNKTPVRVTLTAAEIAEFKKGIA